MSHKVGTSLRYSLLLSVPVWCAFMSSEAMAACTPSNTPANGQTINCAGVGNTPVNAAPGVTGVTVNVQTGASITSEATATASNSASAISVNNNSTIVNNGTILPKLTVNSNHQSVSLNGSNTSLENNGTIQLLNNGTNGAITNNTLYGVVSSNNTGAPDFANVTVVNRGLIEIRQAGTGTAATVYGGEDFDSMTINNYGIISSVRTGGTQSTTRVGAIGSDDDGDEMTIVNHEGATIKATGLNTYGVLGRTVEFNVDNAGTISADGNARGAIVIFGGATPAPATATVVNRSTGVISGNVIITDASPFSATNALTPAATGAAAGNNVGGSVTAATQIRDSTFTNQGTVSGAFTYGAGTHVLDNSGTITGSIFVQQAAQAAPNNFGGAPVGIGGASFTLTNSGTLGGNITIRDRVDSVNDITLQGTGFTGNIIAVNGTGTNSLSLQGVTNLASVQRFKNLDLNRSNVTVTNGISLVNGATVKTTIYGPGGTRAAPSTNIGSINGTLTLAGATTLTPKLATLVRDGDVYQVASTVNGAGAGTITVSQRQSALVQTSRVDTSDGRLLLVTNVRDPRNFAGVSQPTGATLNGLLTYDGINPQVRALGAAVEALPTQAAVRAAGDQLAPNTNGADIQIPINATMLFHQQIDARLDNYIFAQIPSSGRSADLGTGRPAPVYGVLPADGGWIEGIGGGVHQSTVNNVGGYNAELEGVIGGIDRLITPNIRVGGAFGFINAEVNGNQVGGRRETIQTFQGLGYAEFSGANYYLRGSAGYGGVNFQSSRQIAFAGFSDTAFGSHSGNVFTARGEGGAPVEYRNSLLVPYAAFTYSRLEQNAFTEVSANGAGLAYQFARNNSERSEVGGKVIVPLAGLPAFSYLFPAGSTVALEARAAYVHEFGNVAQTVSASFSGGGVFVAAGPVPNRDMVDYGVGLRMGSGPVQIDISYNGLARSTYLQQVGLLRARYLF